MAQTAEKEPTMEEILASIRRIISEDADEPPRAEQDRGPDAAPVADPEATEQPADEPAAQDDGRTDEAEGAADILELTDRVEPEAQAPAAEGDASEDDPSEAGSRAEDEDDAEERWDGPDPRTVEQLLDERLVSDQAERRAGASFAELSAMMVGGYEGSSHTLEGLVREMLKPMLKAWLDENLPRIVEEIVEGEVQRIAARSRRK